MSGGAYIFDSKRIAKCLFVPQKGVTILINNFHFSIYLGLDRHFIRINRCNYEII